MTEMAGQEALFPSAEFTVAAPLRYRPLTSHVWTENKAQLIARYLREFVFVTKHGTYIDLFAGRQNEHLPAGWSAEQVLKMQPNAFKLRHYRLFEIDTDKVEDLRSLLQSYSDLDASVAPGDSNRRVIETLPKGSVGSSEATFCLIDQRTTECEWKTCVHVSQLKSGGYKPELFYFFAQAWFNRAIRSRRSPAALRATNAWWGRDDWLGLVDMSALERAELMARRFKDELGYRFATPWPIRSRSEDGRVMFHMIHATDHERAPALMRRAYEWAVAPVRDPDDEEQLRIELSGFEY